MSYTNHKSSGTSIVSQNERTIIVRGGSNQNISIVNGKVKVNGRVIEDLNQYEEKTINISIEGGCGDLTVDVCEEVNITGNSGGIQTHNGNVKVEGDVSGNISTHNGNVACGNVGGGVQTHNGCIMHK